MIKPSIDKVLLKVVEKENTTKSGIYIHDDKVSTNIYEVIAIGPNIGNINIGNKIFCNQYVGDDIEFNSIKYKIVGIDSILAVIE